MVLNMPVLKLNKSWIPVGVITVREAMSMIFDQRAHAVEPESFAVHNFESWVELAALRDKPALRTATLEIRVPEVIVLTNYAETPGKHLAFSRANIFRRDKYTCQYCGKKPGTEALTIDHVVPRSRGGIGSWTNCVLACIDCNFRKANRTPDEAKMRLLSKPYEPKWSPKMVLGRIRRVPVSWEKFVSDAYWNTELKE